MSDLVAFTAFGELDQNPLRMRHPVAVLTVGYRLVLFLMAIGAYELFMLGVAGTEHVQYLFVTCAAVL